MKKKTIVLNMISFLNRQTAIQVSNIYKQLGYKVIFKYN